MTLSEYYAHPYLSNSALTKMENDLSGQDQYDATDAYAMGGLIDAMLTQPDSVDYLLFRVKDRDYAYTREQFDLARRMKVCALCDPLVRMIVAQGSHQHPFLREGVEFDVDGLLIPRDCRCLYDSWLPPVRWGADFKSTTATTQAGFEAACRKFDYPRGRVFYCKLSGAEKDVVIGISKKSPHRVFKVFMHKGDALWQEGEARLNTLIKKHYLLGL